MHDPAIINAASLGRLASNGGDRGSERRRGNEDDVSVEKLRRFVFFFLFSSLRLICLFLQTVLVLFVIGLVNGRVAFIIVVILKCKIS